MAESYKLFTGTKRRIGEFKSVVVDFKTPKNSIGNTEITGLQRKQVLLFQPRSIILAALPEVYF